MTINFNLNRIQLAIITVFMVVAIDMLGLTLVIPVLPTFTQYLGASQALVGVLFTVFSGACFISGLYVPYLSDKYGRRFTFLFAATGAFGAYVGCGCANSFTELVVWRGIAGLFSGTIGSAYAYIVDIVPLADRSSYMGYVTATMSTCFVVGPLIGGGLATFGIRVPFYAAAAVAGCGWVMVMLFLQEPSELLKAAEDNGKPAAATTDAAAGSSSGQGEAAQQADIETVIVAVAESVASEVDEVVPTAASSVKVADSSLAPSGDELMPAPSGKVATSDSAVDDTTKPVTSSPYRNPLAVIVGGLGTFFNSVTYTGFAVMFPLLLLDPYYGVTRGSGRRLAEAGGGPIGGDKKISSADAQAVSLTVGYVLGLIGLFQAITMIVIYPRLTKYIGIIYTAAIGTFLSGLSLCLFLVVHNVPEILPLAVFFAIGNGLARPAFPAYLGQIAVKGQSAAYVSLSSNFGMAAMMAFAQVSLLFAVNRTAAFLLAGFASIGNCFMLAAVGFIVNNMTVLDNSKKQDAPTALPVAPLATKSRLELFFGEGKPREEFWADAVRRLDEVVEQRHWSKAITFVKGQALITDILLEALPLLPEDFNERMDAVYHLYHRYGHGDWAKGLANEVESLKHYGTTASLGIPGAV